MYNETMILYLMISWLTCMFVCCLRLWEDNWWNEKPDDIEHKMTGKEKPDVDILDTKQQTQVW